MWRKGEELSGGAFGHSGATNIAMIPAPTDSGSGTARTSEPSTNPGLGTGWRMASPGSGRRTQICTDMLSMVPGPLPYARGELRSAASEPRWSQTKEVEMTRDSTGWSSNAVIIEHIERIISSLGGRY